MKQFTSLSGFIAVELTGADIPGLLHAMTQSGIALFRVQHKDFLTVYAWVRRRDRHRLSALAEKKGAAVNEITRNGVYWFFISLLRRPIMIAGITLILLLSYFLPTMVLFVTVDGNASIPDNLILEKAADCGIAFGANRSEVRSEKMKNELLEALPDLKWTGINTYGCTAVISVQERIQKDVPSTSHGVSSIVAERDGIIHSATVTSGNVLCSQGQAVRAGEVLVSGYRDCGIKIQATRAKAEVFAQTVRKLSVMAPMDYAQKGDIDQMTEKYSLILGKKRINFSKDSGISSTSCDKMYLQYYCVLPGGFSLPISIVVERWYCRNTDTVIAASETAQVCTEEFAQSYLSEQMLSGKILGKMERVDFGDAVYTLTGRYICLEMIGRERSEEIIKHHEQSD